MMGMGMVYIFDLKTKKREYVTRERERERETDGKKKVDFSQNTTDNVYTNSALTHGFMDFTQ